jgi:hypothetical protein
MAAVLLQSVQISSSSPGSRKANVLPLPVGAMTKRSRLASTHGMACRCTHVGSSKCIAETFSSSLRVQPSLVLRSANAHRASGTWLPDTLAAIWSAEVSSSDGSAGQDLSAVLGGGCSAATGKLDAQHAHCISARMYKAARSTCVMFERECVRNRLYRKGLQRGSNCTSASLEVQMPQTSYAGPYRGSLQAQWKRR